MSSHTIHKTCSMLYPCFSFATVAYASTKNQQHHKQPLLCLLPPTVNGTVK